MATSVIADSVPWRQSCSSSHSQRSKGGLKIAMEEQKTIVA